ncbi:MAG TPA: FIST N-terminal domain-containing protein [Iamia sp.]|nr:FIST N-terminal domain-containing protein [Iamia sp.]
MTAFAAALSEHPSPPEAVGEVVGAVLDRIGPAPDLAMLFLSPALAGAADDIAATVQATLQPGCLVGAAASTVVGGEHEVEHGPAIALWAGRTGPVLPVRITAEPADGGVRVLGVPQAAGEGGPRTMVLVADPFSLPLDALLATMADDLPDLTVTGGLASAARGPGGNRLILDGAVHRDGAVGVLLPPGATVMPVVSQGCRPVGEPMIVTEVDGQLLLGLAGQPALDRLLASAASLGDGDRSIFELGPQIGVVVDETLPTFRTGDFLIRNVTGVDPDRRAVAIGAQVEVGTTVQFHVRDADSADEELRDLMAAVAPAPDGRDRGALLFTCNGRGSPFFGQPDHDAEVVSAVVGPALAGMACAGEIGPIGGRNRLHGYTASVVILDAG